MDPGAAKVASIDSSKNQERPYPNGRYLHGMSPMNTLAILSTLTLVGIALSGCTGTETLSQAGSSTVLPLAEVWAEEWGTANGIQINVAGGGSGAGASGLCAGELDLGDMSRAMKDSEKETCRANGIEPVQWKVAFDGISVVTSNKNTFVTGLTVAELASIFKGDARNWNEVDPEFPNKSIHLCYPDSDSGTYEYFNEEILGKGVSPRTGSGVQQSPDDNIIVSCLESDANAIGYFGYAYYVENKGSLKLVSVDGIKPSSTTIADGSYSPLGRPIYIYTDGVPAGGTTLCGYLEYVFANGQDLVSSVGYVPLDAGTLGAMKTQLA